MNFYFLLVLWYNLTISAHRDTEFSEDDDDDYDDNCHADSGSSQSALAALLLSFRKALCPPQSRSDL
ncbi:MAG: hypothetical protein KBT29_11555 [Prevotellaceae bacterium]|nr:hypothetical protein [Candidatus Minthosoma caballi]